MELRSKNETDYLHGAQWIDGSSADALNGVRS